MTPAEKIQGERKDMKLMSLLACSEALRKHGISRQDIYDMAADGMPTINGKTTPEAVLNYVASVLGMTTLPTPRASQNRQNGRSEHLSQPLHGQQSASGSSGRSRRVVRER